LNRDNLTHRIANSDALSASRTASEAGRFPVRPIIANAVLHASAGILLAHNHPSGDPRPSVSDCLATRRLACAAQGIGCTLVDHFVFFGRALEQLPAAGPILGLPCML
jgi:DNA repair protein RadC